MTTFQFSSDAWNRNNIRLTNQIFKLLPMYENKEPWEKQLDTIILELKGYNDIFVDNHLFMILVGKLAALVYCEDQFSFRKTVFEAITALKETVVNTEEK